MPRLPNAKNTPIASEDFVTQMFKTIDKNGDGNVTKAEIIEYGQKYGAALLGDKGQKLFDLIASTEEGKVSIEGNKLIWNNYVNCNLILISDCIAYYKKVMSEQ